MPSTPYQVTDTRLTASALTSVVTTGTTTTTPYGFATAAQGDALVAQVNAIIALLKAQGLNAIQ